MQYHALAADYDGTLATEGQVDPTTIDALRRLRQSGRRVVLVTGRTLEPLLHAFPQIGLCHRVVAENGALVYDPETREERVLGPPPPTDFMELLAKRGVPEMEIGRVIVATWTPHETTVLEAIRDLGLELQIIFNKGAVMVLPTGINKATGLQAALEELGLSPHNTVGIGDAENDEAFLQFCDASAAVANALDPVKQRVDIVLRGARGAGSAELIERLIADDLKEMRSRPHRGILLGTDLDGREMRVPVYRTRVLVSGEPAGGKSKFALSMLKQLMEQKYQTCVIDPEGDYQDLEHAIVLGTREQTPTVDEVVQVIGKPTKSCVVSLFGTATDAQPTLFGSLIRALLDFRSRTGRPHWFLVDEAHYPLPATWEPIGDLQLQDLQSVMYITAFPERLPDAVLRHVDLFVALGEDPGRTLAAYCERIGESSQPLEPPIDRDEHRAIAWWRGKSAPSWICPVLPRGDHKRHLHAYLDGDMEPQFRFYFRGPNGELNLAAQNLRIFRQLGEGVDDATWNYHLQQGDYSRWFRDVIQDLELAKLAEEEQHADGMPDDVSRLRIFDMIRKRYELEA